MVKRNICSYLAVSSFSKKVCVAPPSLSFLDFLADSLRISLSFALLLLTGFLVDSGAGLSGFTSCRVAGGLDHCTDGGCSAM